MNRNISDKLILNLSLYLDNELSKEEMLEIEELLKIDPEVSAIIDSLRSTRLVLRNAPRIKRRKSFTLTANHIKQVKKENGWVNGMRLVSSFSMILLLVVFTQNMLGDWSPLSSADLAESNFVEDTADIEAMEFAVQEAGVEKVAGEEEDIGDDILDDSSPLDAEELEVFATEIVAVECDNTEDCADPIANYDADDALEEGESVLSPEDVVGGGGPPSATPTKINEEEIAVEDDIAETDSDIDTSADDGAAPEVETEEVVTEEIAAAAEEEEAERIAAVEEEVEDATEEVAPTEIDDGKDSTLLILLVVFASISSGAYLFLRKKYS